MQVCGPVKEAFLISDQKVKNTKKEAWVSLYDPIQAVCMGEETGPATSGGSCFVAAKKWAPGQVWTGSSLPQWRQSSAF